MGNTVFLILLILLAAALVLSTAMHEHRRASERRKRIRESFGASDDECHDTDRFGTVPMLFEHMKGPDDFIVDGITVNDLSLKDIYSRMNRCMTSAGEDSLYCRFRIMPSASGDSLYKDIRSFMDDPGKSSELLCILDGYGKRKDTDEFLLISELEKADGKSIVYDIIPFAVFAASLIATAFIPIPAVIAAIISMCVCVYTYFSGKHSIEANLRGLSLGLKLIGCAEELVSAGREEFETYRPVFALRRGKSLIPYKDQSVSDPLSLIFDYVRMLTHIDLIVYKIKIAGIKKHLDEILHLYEDIGKIDALLAVASYLSSKPHCPADELSDNRIEAKGLYHPLVKKPVANDITAERGVLLTGSNASGKSTFLKAVGVSVLFARSFGFAFAESFASGVRTLYTSMALTDNLLGEESYYVVEAKSIKRICDTCDDRCLSIVDEVLKGTNTIERIAASSEILRYLARPGMICLAATHDLELTYLLEDKMDLYHFTEEISEDTVRFPFVIQKGRSDRTNAIRLLAMLGFDGGIVKGADELVERYNTAGKWK